MRAFLTGLTRTPSRLGLTSMDESAVKHAEEIFAMQFDEHKYVFMCRNIIKVFVAHV